MFWEPYGPGMVRRHADRVYVITAACKQKEQTQHRWKKAGISHILLQCPPLPPLNHAFERRYSHMPIWPWGWRLSRCELLPKLTDADAVGWEHAVLQAVQIPPVDGGHELA
jgi:hypothetical protein